MENDVAIQIGDGATVHIGSDSNPYTIIDVSASGKTIMLKADKVERIDNNGMSDIQEYKYFWDPEGEELKATKRKNGSWKIVGTNMIVSIGIRRKFFDFSF